MEKDIDIKGLRLHYDVTGPEHGPAVILMHGWGCSHKTVRSIAALLEGAMRVYNIDLPGHGQSDEPTDVWGVEDFTDLIEEFARRVGAENPVLIGHSFGGRICMIMGSRFPTNKIILVDAAGIKPKRPLSWYFKVYSYKAVKRLAKLLGKRTGQTLIDRWRGRAGSADYNNSTPMMRAIMSRTVNEDLSGYLPSITAPTLLIWGEEDTATPMWMARKIESLVPDSGIVSFPRAGHYSFLDPPYGNPAGFRAAVTNFLKNELRETPSSNHSL